MTRADQLRAIQRCVNNPIEAALAGKRRFAAVLGGNPSAYSKSPRLWNAAFRALGIDAAYIALDASGDQLPELMQALRRSEDLLGFNVTVPHKLEVMPYLDEIDSAARRIGAINTVVRLPDGRLFGANTDGAGFIDSILRPLPAGANSFLTSLGGVNVLLIGAGGSARAVAFALAEHCATGTLWICNRDQARARSLAQEVATGGCRAEAGSESDIGEFARRAGLIVNSTSKGQAGMHLLSDGKATTMEPYSALAPAAPVPVDRAVWQNPNREDAAVQRLREDVAVNNGRSLRIARSAAASAFYDLIYAPEETIFLRHGRMTGHKTMNGKGMIIWQAAHALCGYICRNEVQARGLNTPGILASVAGAMYAAW